MAILSSTTIIRTLSIYHLTLSFFLLTNPRIIADQNLVFILGQAMHLPNSTAFHHPTPSTALAAIFLAFLSLSDLTAVSLPSHLSLTHWTSQAPIRLSFLFALTGYIFWFASSSTSTLSTSTQSPGPGAHVKNSVVFTWSFVELAAWFWIFVVLREERKKGSVEAAEKRRAEEERL